MPQNYLNAFRGPNLAEIDRSAYSNALMRNDVQRLPQRNAAEDQAIQAEQQMHQQGMDAAQTKGASEFLVRSFSLMAQDPQRAQEVIASPAFQSASRALQLPAFSVDGETPETISQKSAGWMQALSGQPAQQQRVQSTQILEDGSIAVVTGDGQVINTGHRARAPQQVVDIAGAPALVNRQTAQVTPLSDPTAENQAAANRAAATAAGETRGGLKSVRLQAAVRRLERVRAASEALKVGGPIIGAASGMTPAGQELNQANAQLLTELTALTRVPGVGSQSDLEQRLAQLQLPTAEMYPSVRARAIAELEAFMADLEAALGSVEQVNGQNSQGMPDFTKMSDDELRRLAGGR